MGFTVDAVNFQSKGSTGGGMAWGALAVAMTFVQSRPTTPPLACLPADPLTCPDHLQHVRPVCARPGECLARCHPALSLTCAQRPSEVRQQLEQSSHMPVDDAPSDHDVRQSYNFAPGYRGLVYRADGRPDAGPATANGRVHGEESRGKQEDRTTNTAAAHFDSTKYKLQAMKWGKSAALPAVAAQLTDAARPQRSRPLLDET